MKIGIVKPKFNKKQKNISYILLPIIGIIVNAVLLSTIPNIGLSYLLVLIFTISFFIILDVYIEDYCQIGSVEIFEEKFIIQTNEEELYEIKVSEIRKVILKPNLGISKSNYIYKSYLCDILLEDKKYQFEITREEIRENTLIRKNIINRNAFDFIGYLKEKKIRLEVQNK
jgi:hypothetical protein